MEGRLKYKIQQYEDAVVNFKDSLSIDFKEFSEKVIDSIKSGRVHKFEFCTELLWKTLKIYLEEYEKVMEMLDDRNRLRACLKIND